MSSSSSESGAPSGAPPSRSSALCALVTVRWGDTVLATRHVRDGEQASVGAAVDTLSPIPCEPLGMPAVVVATVRDAAPIAFVPRGAVGFRERGRALPVPLSGPSELKLALHETVSYAIGGFVVTITAEENDKAPWAAAAPLRSSLSPFRYVGIAAVAHALLIGLSAQAAYAGSLESAEPDTEDLRRYLAASEERSAVDEKITSDFGEANLGVDVNSRDGNGTDGGGTRAKGLEGSMGSRESRSRSNARFGVGGDPKSRTAPATRAEALADAETFGIAGILASETHRIFSTFGDAPLAGVDPFDARGSMWATSVGETHGAGGLGLTGVGEGGGGVGEGIGLGTIGTIGHTYGKPGLGTGGAGGPMMGGIGISGWSDSWHGGWRDGIHLGTIGTLGHGAGTDSNPHVPKAPKRPEKVEAEGESRLPADAIRRIVRQSAGVFRACYQSALVANPTLAGRVTTRFMIGADGRVKSTGNAGSDLPDTRVVQCVTRAFGGLTFPAPPDGRPVSVTYPLTFSPMP